MHQTRRLFTRVLSRCRVCRQTAGVRAPDTPSCTGTRTVIVHNGTLQTLEVALSNGGLSDRVIEVIAPTQRSTTIRLQGATYVRVREQGTRRVIDYRETRVRYEYGCQN